MRSEEVGREQKYIFTYIYIVMKEPFSENAYEQEDTHSIKYPIDVDKINAQVNQVKSIKKTADEIANKDSDEADDLLSWFLEESDQMTDKIELKTTPDAQKRLGYLWFEMKKNPDASLSLLANKKSLWLKFDNKTKSINIRVSYARNHTNQSILFDVVNKDWSKEFYKIFADKRSYNISFQSYDPNGTGNSVKDLKNRKSTWYFLNMRKDDIKTYLKQKTLPSWAIVTDITWGELWANMLQVSYGNDVYNINTVVYPWAIPKVSKNWTTLSEDDSLLFMKTVLKK